MINLFHIPVHKIDTAKFSSLLHDKIVRDFEERFADYVGAKYAVSFNSATSALFLYFSLHRETILKNTSGLGIAIPSLIPPVVANAVINAGIQIRFQENIGWVGNSYYLWGGTGDLLLVDSAQQVVKNQYKGEQNVWGFNKVSALYSFYPTKPIGSCDGGMIVSNDSSEAEALRELSFNGMSQEPNNWERSIKRIGHKMYMNSVSAYIANQNLKKYGWKRERLFIARDFYNNNLPAFGNSIKNTSDHLYRIPVSNNREFVKKAAKEGIVCGIHYDALHLNPLYQRLPITLPLSEHAGKTMVSIPFHEKLTQRDMKKVIEFVKKNR